MTMFGLECMPLFIYLLTWLSFGCQASVLVFPQLHPGTKVEMICPKTWQVMKDGKSAKPAKCPKREI